MCRNPKVLIGLAVVATVAVALFAPNVGAVVPLLLIAACPLMMLVMMGGVAGIARGRHDDASRDDTSEDSEMARLRQEVAELRARAGR